jgi:hypothetical protein
MMERAEGENRKIRVKILYNRYLLLGNTIQEEKPPNGWGQVAPFGDPNSILIVRIS